MIKMFALKTPSNRISFGKKKFSSQGLNLFSHFYSFYFYFVIDTARKISMDLTFRKGSHEDRTQYQEDQKRIGGAPRGPGDPWRTQTSAESRARILAKSRTQILAESRTRTSAELRTRGLEH